MRPCHWIIIKPSYIWIGSSSIDMSAAWINNWYKRGYLNFVVFMFKLDINKSKIILEVSTKKNNIGKLNIFKNPFLNMINTFFEWTMKKTLCPFLSEMSLYKFLGSSQNFCTNKTQGGEPKKKKSVTFVKVVKPFTHVTPVTTVAPVKPVADVIPGEISRNLY